MKRLELEFERPPALQATAPPERRGLARDEVRLLVTSSHGHEHARFLDLPRFLNRGTLLVVNSSATLPASLPAWHARIGPITANVSTRYGRHLYLVEFRWSVSEPGPLPLSAGESITIAGLAVRLLAPYPGLPRLWYIHVEEDLTAAMYRVGRPIRYGYLEPPYPLLEQYQTIFGRVKGSAEMPSAARPFTARVVETLRAKGTDIATVTLHAGVSSHEVEAEEVEKETLFAEPFRVSRETALAVNAARDEGRLVIAVGTTVVRALESAWDGVRVHPAAGFTRVFVQPGRPPHSVDGLVTGLHDPLASHLAMLYSIASGEVVRSAYAEAVREGYLWHEFGDSHLILGSHLLS